MRHAAFHYAVLLAAIAAAAPASARTWTNRAGKTLEADFVRLEGDKVVLLIGGKETPVALDQLSDADQAFARDQAAGSAPAAEPAPAVTDITKRRKWTDVAGSTITAAFGGIEREMVGFIDGRQTQRVPFASLCEADQALICRFLESRGLGLSIPPKVLDISKQSIRVWTDRKGRAVQGILRQIEPEGEVVLQTARSLSRLPFDGFSDSDQEHLRKVAEEWELVENLPADRHLRTWYDWLGNAFTAKLDPSHKPQHWSSQIYFLSPEKEQFSKDFTELSEADRERVLKLAQAAGGGRFLKSFPEPDSPAREWAIGGSAATQTARFVRLEQGQVVLRTASDPAREVALSSLAAADREYVRKEMRRRGQSQLVPLLRDECREWIYGPAGIGNVLVGQLDAAAGSVVRLRLPDANYASEAEAKTAELSFVALSPADQEFVTTSLKIDRNSLLPTAAAIPLEARDWKLDGGRQAIRGSLVYVVPNEIFIGDVQSQRGVTFASLSAADQEYVCRAVVTYGQAKFDRPPPPPRTGVVRIDPTPPGRGYVSTPPRVRNYSPPRTYSAPQPGRGSAAYQAGYACGSFMCVGILIFLVILLVTRMSQ